MRGVRCTTTRAPIATFAEAQTIAAGVAKGATPVQCPSCGYWHVVGIGSALERPTKKRGRKR